MIEMQWVKIKFGNFKKESEQLEKYTNVGGFPCILRFREVNTAGDRVFATDWQDVEIAKEVA